MLPQTFIFIGKSGSGKGTQADLLAEHLKRVDPQGSVFRLETGSRFRDFIKNDTYTSALAHKIYLAGGLMPEFLSINIWGGCFVDEMKDGQHIIIDGTPRKLHEANVLDSALKFYGRVRPAIIYLNVSHDWAEQKLKARHRMDDSKRDIKERLRWYETDVAPTVEFYRTAPGYNFVEIHGERSVEKVHQDILKAVFGEDNTSASA